MYDTDGIPLGSGGVKKTTLLRSRVVFEEILNILLFFRLST